MSDRKEWQQSYQPINYNGYDSCGLNSQSIGQHGDHNHYGQYNFTHQGGSNNQYDSSSQFGGQYVGHNYVGGFGGHNYVGRFGGQYRGHNYVGRPGGQYGGHNNVGGYDLMNQNGLSDQNGFGGQNNQMAWEQYSYPYGQNNSGNIYDQPSYGSHQTNHPNGCNGQNVLNIGERPYVDCMDKERQSMINETSKVTDAFMEMADSFRASNEFLIQGLRGIASRLAIEEQVLSQ